MTVETASSEIGGDKAGWITEAMLTNPPRDYLGVRAFTWFNTVTHGLKMVAAGVVIPTADIDWRVTGSPAAFAAYAEAANDAYFQGTLP